MHDIKFARILLMITVMVTGLMLVSACGRTQTPAVQWEAVYPQFILAEAEDSILLRDLQTHNAVLVFNNEAVTPGENAERFVKAAADGGTDELYILDYRVWNQGQGALLNLTLFTSEDGVISRQNNRWQGSVAAALWDQELASLATSPKEPVDSVSLYEAYLGANQGYVTTGYTVKNLRDIARIAQPDIFDRYLDFLSSSGSLQTAWHSPAELQLMYVFEDIYCQNVGGTLRDYFTTDAEDYFHFSPDEVLAVLSGYFDGLTRELVIENAAIWYDASTDTILYTGGRGDSPSAVIVGADELAGTIDYFLTRQDGARTPTTEALYRLTFETKSDGTFVFIANERL